MSRDGVKMIGVFPLLLDRRLSQLSARNMTLISYAELIRWLKMAMSSLQRGSWLLCLVLQTIVVSSIMLVQ